ncbi:MAG: M4 family metallopeptidase [Acidobacteriota bacterium]
MTSDGRLGRWLLGFGLLALAAQPSGIAQVRQDALRVAIGTDERAPRISELRQWDARITRMLRDGELRLRRADDDEMVAGRRHERLDQYHRDVPVFGGQLVRQLEREQTVSIFGTLYTGIDIDAEPTLTPSEAARRVADVSGVMPSPDDEPELMVVALDLGTFGLAYRARTVTLSDIVVFFIDAHSGAVVFQYSDLQTTVGSGTGVHSDTKKLSTSERGGRFVAWDQLRPAAIYTYDMKGDLTRTRSYLNGFIALGDNDFASDADNTWEDPAAVDAHAYAGWTYDYLYKRFNRLGLDGHNRSMTSIVHPVSRDAWRDYPGSVIGLYYLNAFYAGRGIMVYGEGLPPTVTSGGYRWNYFAGALDVVAHELTHGVTDYSSDLIYLNEPGALNEAFSDIIGTSAEFYFQDVGSGYMRADYVLGEDLTSPMGGFRSMANPGAFGDPDHYSKRYLGPADNGGVHSNSGIANHAFYLAIEGGVNRTSGLAVQGVGGANRDRIEKVFFRAFTQMLPANATFSIARAATIQAARDLYGAGSGVETAITQAWTACGVF